ncbi:hypothetical protein GIB67_035324 [Kingdonia uniflora]|uniref:Uncharacterized protein n=1 Tax=Kingdonia uniflora TaxID=39325 RepID=A0A7J7KY19_9MAGN|nr:hypothetical protein GIB67_035324 [Kingdonia uniflora]
MASSGKGIALLVETGMTMKRRIQSVCSKIYANKNDIAGLTVVGGNLYLYVDFLIDGYIDLGRMHRENEGDHSGIKCLKMMVRAR